MKFKFNNYSILGLISCSTVIITIFFKIYQYLIFGPKDPSSDIMISIHFLLILIPINLCGILIGTIGLFRDRHKNKKYIKIAIMLNLLMIVSHVMI